MAYGIWHMAYAICHILWHIWFFSWAQFMEPQKEGIAWGDWCEKRERRREVDVLEWEETKVMFFSSEVHVILLLPCRCPPLLIFLLQHKTFRCLCPPVFSFY